MKRKEINEKTKANGYHINEFTRGFLGEKNEGNKMLQLMGLQIGIIPFSAITFFRNQKVCWKDKDGNVASISFRIKENQIECFGTYLKNHKSIRLFCEWEAYEDREVIARLESEAIGDLCMKCIYENLI